MPRQSRSSNASSATAVKTSAPKAKLGKGCTECTYEEYLGNYRENFKYNKKDIQAQLLKDPIKLLKHHDSSPLNFITDPILLEYIATLKPGPNLELALQVLRIVGCTFAQTLEIANILDPGTLLRIVEVLAETWPRSEEYDGLLQQIWSSLPSNTSDRYRLFAWDIVSRAKVLKDWRDRALALLPEDTGHINSLIIFLLRSCQCIEDASQLFEHLRIHFKGFAANSDLDEVLYCLVGNRFALDACRKFINSEKAICKASVAFTKLLWQVKKERRTILLALKQLNDDQNALVYLASDGNVDDSFIVAAAKGGFENIATALIKSNPSKAILSAITLSISSGKKIDWAFKILVGLPSALLASQINTVKVILDHLDRLTVEQVEKYFGILLRVAKYSMTQQGDSSLSNELALIARKQATSMDSQIILYGSLFLTAMLLSHLDTGEDHDGMLMTDNMAAEEEEATCSQAPRLLYQNRNCNDLASLLEALLIASIHKSDSRPIKQFSIKFATILDLMPVDLLRAVNKLLCRIFEQNFIVELKKHHERHYDCGKEEALIGVDLENPCAPFLFQLLVQSEKKLYKDALDNIDALLGCPLVKDPGPRLTVNWLNTLANAFYDQDDKEVQRKCISRLELISNFLELASESKEAPIMKKKTSAAIPDCLSPFIDELNTSTTTQSIKKSVIFSPTINTSVELDVAVIIKYFKAESIQKLLFATLKIIDLKTLSLDILKQLTSQLPKDCSLDTRLSIAGELERREAIVPSSLIMADLEEFILSMDNKQMSKLLALTSFKEVRERLITKSLDIAFSTEEDDIDGLFEQILKIKEFDIKFLETVVLKFTNAKLRKPHILFKVLLGSLSLVRVDSLQSLKRCFELFGALVSFARSNATNAKLLESVLRYSKSFINLINKDTVHLLEQNLNVYRTEVVDILKLLQQSTRSLQIICNHIKADRRAFVKHQSLLPSMRKTLEALLYRVKSVLQANGCISAFWVGNLKHRTIDGTEIEGSQIIIDQSETETEPEPETGTEPEPETDTTRFHDIDSNDDDGEPDKKRSRTKKIKSSEITTDTLTTTFDSNNTKELDRKQQQQEQLSKI